MAKKGLIWRCYITAKALPTTKRVELINEKKFAKAALDKESETFIVYVAALEAPLRSVKMMIYPAQAVQIAVLKQDEAPTKVSPKYADYADIFSFDLAIEFPDNTGINEHTIKLKKDKQLPYRPIYSLRPLELETLKTYIETHLKTGFIQSSKSLAGALILFDNKPGGSFWLCVNYQDFNNLTIKNRYPPSLIGEVLDWFGRTKQFT